MNINENVRTYVQSLSKEERNKLLTALLRNYKIQRGLFYAILLLIVFFAFGMIDGVFDFNLVVLSTSLAFLLLFFEKKRITRKKIKDGYGLEV